MLREDPSSISPDRSEISARGRGLNTGTSSNRTDRGEAARPGNTGSVDIQRELNRLEEMILDSPRIPLSRRTLIDEEQLLEQLDLVRLSLPEAFHEAEEIVRQKEEMLMQAEQYAQDLIEQAEQRAAQIMDEMGILRQAELESQQLRQLTQQECETAREQTLAEIEQTRRQAQRELEEMQRMAIAECEEIQVGADDYADRVLTDMEVQLAEMLRVIRNGRQQLSSNQSEPLPPRREPGTGRSQISRSDRPSPNR